MGKPWLRQASCAPLRTGEPEVQRLTVPLRLAEPRPGRRSENGPGFVNPRGEREWFHLCRRVLTECVNLARASWCYKVSYLTSAAIWAGRWRSMKSCPNSRRPDRVTVRCFHAEPCCSVFIDSPYHSLYWFHLWMLSGLPNLLSLPQCDPTFPERLMSALFLKGKGPACLEG